MKIMLVGDTHGDAKNVIEKMHFAKKVGGIQRIVILGDFGLWWGYDGLKFIEEINRHAEANNLQVFAIPGNHENYEWWNSVVKNAPAHSKGWAYLSTHVLLSPRVHDFVWGNKQFVVAGGAVSIDKEWREEHRRRTGKRVWSPDEQLTDAELKPLFASRFANGTKVDYLLTHDCSDHTNFKHRLKPDHDSVLHRRRIDSVLKAIKPKNHFHGHMHEKYDWVNEYVYGYSAFSNESWEGPSTQTYGFECNQERYSWGILDLDEDKFQWGYDILHS
jgi:hypothetical protein